MLRAIIKAIKIKQAEYNHARANNRYRKYMSSDNRHWNVHVAQALELCECMASNDLARLINPNSIDRAW